MPSAWPRTGQAIRLERFGGGWLSHILSLRVNRPSLLIPIDIVSDFRGEVDFFGFTVTDFLTEEFWYDQPGDLAHPTAVPSPRQRAGVHRPGRPAGLSEQGTATAYIEPGKPWQNEVEESYNARLRDERLNMELFTGLPDARVSIETYRQYFFEERFHGALGYVPPREFKEQWLTAHPDFCMGALPPRPRDLTLDASKQRGNEKSRTAREDGPASAPMTGRRSGCVPAEPYPLTGNWIGEEIRT
ncbi:MAG TPA: transposase [Anaerohalosphaeraceae bacterium]|nr:transposase [Anaerohalosphaeraceae bacterium]